MKCPLCAEGIKVEVHVEVCMTWTTAMKLRLAGPEARCVLLDELTLRMTELAMHRMHPENEGPWDSR